MADPTHRNEHTGMADLDRIQATVRELIVQVKSLLARFNRHERVSLMLAAAFTTTLATIRDTGLGFDVLPGEIWDLDYYGEAGCAGDALGMKYAIGAPMGTTITGYLDSNLTTAVDDTHVAITTVNTLTSAVHTVNGNTRPDHINVRLKVAGTPGRVYIGAACTTAGRTTTVGAGAYLRACRVVEV
jgi:hypothetical protein